MSIDLVLPAVGLGFGLGFEIRSLSTLDADRGSLRARVRVFAEHACPDIVDNPVSSKNSNLVESTALKLSITNYYLYFTCLWAFHSVQVLVRSDFSQQGFQLQTVE